MGYRVAVVGATGNVGDTLTFTLLGGSPGYSLAVSNGSAQGINLWLQNRNGRN